MDFDDLVCEYFEARMRNIYLLNRHTGGMINFYKNCLNPTGKYCYFLSVVALMGLLKGDKRFCGTIDPMPRPGYQKVENYKHSWVEYVYNNEVFVYDPLFGPAIPRDSYYKNCNPRKITSKRTQVEVLKPYLNSQFAYKITDTIWQFKSKQSTETNATEKSNGYIFSALQKGHLIGHFEDAECDIISFIADEPRVYD